MCVCVCVCVWNNFNNHWKCQFNAFCKKISHYYTYNNTLITFLNLRI